MSFLFEERRKTKVKKKLKKLTLRRPGTGRHQTLYRPRRSACCSRRARRRRLRWRRRWRRGRGAVFVFDLFFVWGRGWEEEEKRIRKASGGMKEQKTR